MITISGSFNITLQNRYERYKPSVNIRKYLEKHNIPNKMIDEIILHIEQICRVEYGCVDSDKIYLIDSVIQKVYKEIEEKRLRQAFNQYLINRYLTEGDCKWDRHEITYYNIK